MADAITFDSTGIPPRETYQERVRARPPGESGSLGIQEAPALRRGVTNLRPGYWSEQIVRQRFQVRDSDAAVPPLALG